MSAARSAASSPQPIAQQRIVASVSSWPARLALEFERRGARSVLSRREQYGPLTLQKPLYPEGNAVCHCVVLHPPGGIVGGDQLAVSLRVHAGAHALITTPGASKWYRSADIEATQHIEIDVADGACCEWLPQENIFFNGAHASSEVNLRLSGDALAFGWDINCLGRLAADERFDKGMLRLAVKVEHDASLIWLERARLAGDDPLMSSPIGLRGYSVFATAYLAGRDCDAALLEALREAGKPGDAQVGITALPRLLVARYLGNSAEQARRYFVELWQLLRVAMLARPACSPRIWNT
jgi:urease accessory protein